MIHHFRLIDKDLGEEIPEKDYGGTCRIYDAENPQDPWHNLKVSLILKQRALKDSSNSYSIFRTRLTFSLWRT